MDGFFAFVYTDVLLAIIVKTMKTARNNTVFVSRKPAYGAPHAKNAHFCIGRLERFLALFSEFHESGTNSHPLSG